MVTFTDVFLSVLVVFVASCVYKFLSGLKAVNYIPGLRVPFDPMSLFGALLPTSFLNPGLMWPWEWRKTSYFNRQYDVISMVPFITGRAVFYTGSLDVHKQLMLHETKMPMYKPRDQSQALLLWGENLVAANGDVWKRHRRIVAPAFSQNLFSFVLKESIATCKELVVAENWIDKEIVIKDISHIMEKFAIIIISRCGFGQTMQWNEDQNEKDGSFFGKALITVASTSILRLAIPSFAYSLPIKSLHVMDKAWKSLDIFMHDMVAKKKEELAATGFEGRTDQNDVFSRLVGALDEDSKLSLDEDEVIGNTFTLMFAGHETTAHTLTATLGFLAIYQDEQKKAYQEISDAVPNIEELTLDDLSKLKHTLACFHEALRIYPAGFVLVRDFDEDTLIKVVRPTEQTIVLPKGSRMIVDMISIHQDPHTFPEPQKYKPSRWYDVPDHDIPMFSVGPRACIGRKFAQVEALSFLAAFLKEWRVDIVLKDGETREAYEERVMGNAGTIGLAFGVRAFKLKLIKRG